MRRGALAVGTGVLFSAGTGLSDGVAAELPAADFVVADLTLGSFFATAFLATVFFATLVLAAGLALVLTFALDTATAIATSALA